MAIDRTKITQQAEKLVVQGRVDAAIAHYELLVRDNPRDMNTINKIGDLYSRLGKRREAIAQYSKIGEFYAKDGFLLKAIAIYKKITKLDPTHMDTYQRLADLYAQQGLVLEARAQYLFVSERSLKAGDNKRAIIAYEALVKVDPDNHKHRVALADLIAKNGRAAEAAEEYARAGAEMERRGMAQEARALYQKASTLQPGSPQAAARLASSHAAEGDLQGAVGIVQEALRKHGENVDLLVQLSDLMVRAGRVQEAEAALHKAAGHAPARGDVRLRLGSLKLAAGDPEAAFTTIESHLGAFIKERAADLLSLLEGILRANPRHRGALRAAGEAYATAQNEEKSIRCLTMLLDLSIESEDHLEGLKVAERLVKLRPADQALAAKLALIQNATVARPGSAARPDAGPSSAGSRPDRPPAFAENGATPTSSRAPVAPELDVDVPPAQLEPEDEDFITEHMTEADVFVKYGLGDRAVEQLMAVLERYPAYAPAHEKLKEIYLDEGNREAAQLHMAQAVRAHLAREDRSAAGEALDELRRFDPAGREAAELEALMEGGAAQPWVGPEAREEAPGGLVVSEAVFEPPAATTTAAPEATREVGANAPAAEDLSEVDRCLSHGQHEAAVSILRRLAESFGSHPEILARMRQAMAVKQTGTGLRHEAAAGSQTARVAQPAEEEFEIFLDEEEISAVDEHAPSKTSAVPPSPPRPAVDTSAREGGLEDLLDLAAEIDAALGAASGSAESLVTGEGSTPEGHSLDEIVDAFRRGIEQQVGAEDYDTHYNLGIAYKEMGLVDEAIGEFQFAAKDKKLLVDCCSMLGICFREKGMSPLAVKWYRRGLEVGSARGEETMLGLRYDLADLLLEMGHHREALDLFTEVFGTNSQYRDVAARLKDLEGTLPR